MYIYRCVVKVVAPETTETPRAGGAGACGTDIRHAGPVPGSWSSMRRVFGLAAAIGSWNVQTSTTISSAEGADIPTPKRLQSPFVDNLPAPGLPSTYKYAFQVPVLQHTPGGALLAYSEAHMLIFSSETNPNGSAPIGSTWTNVARHHQAPAWWLSDGDDGWIDIVVRRSARNGTSGLGSAWAPQLHVLCRNSTGNLSHGPDAHACEQPSPVSDFVTKMIHVLFAIDNWWPLLVTSSDDGLSWGPPRNLTSSLRRPGWGAIFPGLPGPGIQLRAPGPHPGRLILCASAYWWGGKLNGDGTVGHNKASLGASASRFSYSIVSDDGENWRIGSGPIGPAHTSECSFAQSHSNTDLYMYARIFDAKFDGPQTPKRGLAKSTDGGSSWLGNATLTGTGLPDDAPDCEGSFISTPGAGGKTCWLVSAPRGEQRNHLTLRRACGFNGPAAGLWDPPVLIDAGDASYSSLVCTEGDKSAESQAASIRSHSSSCNRVLILYWKPYNGKPSGGIQLVLALDPW